MCIDHVFLRPNVVSHMVRTLAWKKWGACNIATKISGWAAKMSVLGKHVHHLGAAEGRE